MGSLLCLFLENVIMAKNAAYLVLCARNWARSKNITFNGGVLAGTAVGVSYLHAGVLETMDQFDI